MPSARADPSCSRGISTWVRCGLYRSQLPWSAGAGVDLNSDGFTSDLVPGTTRNSGSRDLNLDAVNAYRALTRPDAPIEASTIDSSRVNIMDLRVSKRIRFSTDRRLGTHRSGVQCLQHRESAGAVWRRTRDQCALEHVRPDHERAATAPGGAGGPVALVNVNSHSPNTPNSQTIGARSIETLGVGRSVFGVSDTWL